MKTISALILLLFCVSLSFGQNEQSPIVEKEFVYKDWTYKNVNGDTQSNLRELTKGKKLTMVVYFAPWCPNWKHDIEFVKDLYDKYASKGLQIVAVGEYDPVDAMKKHIETYKLKFPVVYESESSKDYQKTPHYEYRKATGDTRKWGSPWYVFLDDSNLEKSGETISKKANVVNGELIQDDAEKFIKTKLGLTKDAKSSVAGN